MRVTRMFNQVLTLAMLMALIAAGMFMAPVASAKGKGGPQNNNNNGGGNPNIECPAGTTLVAKFNYEGGSYVFEKPAGNAGVVTISGGSATGGSFTSTAWISAVIIKGGAGPVATKTDTYNPSVQSGSFNNTGLLNNGGQVPAISNIQFCGGEAPPPPPDDCCIKVANIDVFDIGNQIQAKVAVVYTDGYVPTNVDVTVVWTTPDGQIGPMTVNTTADGTADNIATITIPQGGDGVYTVKVVGADGFDGTPFCGEAEASIQIRNGCCLEAYNVVFTDMGDSIKAEVYVKYTDGYIPDNVDVTVSLTTPAGTMSETKNTTADGTADNIATFIIAKSGAGSYTVAVTDADGFDGTPLCRSVTRTYEAR